MYKRQVYDILKYIYSLQFNSCFLTIAIMSQLLWGNLYNFWLPQFFLVHLVVFYSLQSTIVSSLLVVTWTIFIITYIVVFKSLSLTNILIIVIVKFYNSLVCIGIFPFAVTSLIHLTSSVTWQVYLNYIIMA